MKVKALILLVIIISNNLLVAQNDTLERIREKISRFNDLQMDSMFKADIRKFLEDTALSAKDRGSIFKANTSKTELLTPQVPQLNIADEKDKVKLKIQSILNKVTYLKVDSAVRADMKDVEYFNYINNNDPTFELLAIKGIKSNNTIDLQLFELPSYEFKGSLSLVSSLKQEKRGTESDYNLTGIYLKTEFGSQNHCASVSPEKKNVTGSIDRSYTDLNFTALPYSCELNGIGNYEAVISKYSKPIYFSFKKNKNYVPDGNK